MSVHGEGAPDFRAPPGSCDAHFHVFGPGERYPYSADLRYKPPLAPLEDYLELARHLGIERHVFVQPSAYGRDNACLLDALRAVGSKCRGIVDMDENIPDAELDRLNGLGVRGVRVNVNPIKPPEPGFSKTMLARIERLDQRCAEIGWMLDFLTPGWLTQELLPTLNKLKVTFTVAHMGMFLARDGVKQPGFQQFLDFLRDGSGRSWVKLTGVYRMSVTPRFTDADPMARALIEAVPDRLIWGSDYPHLSFADKVGSVELFNLLGRWAPEEATRRKILVDNPARLFRF
ncbi:MAG: amidohydrolase family protein [Betaproteobacteria bacterium]|nr:amidohydrolase family protein [Betaproteobacteria bacterium]MDH3438361.1 amidohydrolase family protein [Betaproteobacteria bacterium]